jgi:hypothetical protein
MSVLLRFRLSQITAIGSWHVFSAQTRGNESRSLRTRRLEGQFALNEILGTVSLTRHMQVVPNNAPRHPCPQRLAHSALDASTYIITPRVRGLKIVPEKNRAWDEPRKTNSIVSRTDS